MSHTTITRVVNGREVLDYILSEQGHNDNEVRNQLIIPVNMSPGDVSSYYAQMSAHWRHRSSKCVYDMNHIILSFSRNELDPDDPNSILIAGQIGKEFHEKVYPGHQAIIGVQTDGKSGLVHVHIGESCTNMFTHRGCTKEQTWDCHLRREMDAIIEKYMDIDHGVKGGSKNKQSVIEKRTRGEYVWKDDVVERIKETQAEATDLDDFLARLPAHGLKGEAKHSKKYGDYITYELIDTSGFGDKKIPMNLKNRSYKLDQDYKDDFSPNMKFGKDDNSALYYSAGDVTSYTPTYSPSITPAPAPTNTRED